MKIRYLLFLILTVFPLQFAAAETLPPNFKVTNEMIYQKLIEIEKRQAVFEERFKQIDRRFEQIDRRFEQVDKRFEQIDRRFEEIDKRFEQIDRRFEELKADMNQRFDDMFRYLNILAAIFTTFTVSVLAFAYWDRRTIISKAKEETIREIESSGKLITVLRKKAKTDKELEKILKELGLL